jgi:putative ABC transport system permease protein
VANDPYREGMLEGNFLTADDREGLLLGKPAADKLHLKVGDTVNLSVNTSNGDVQEQIFTVRGLYSTDTYGFDVSTVFLPIAKVQALTQTENHASTIFVLLNDTADTDQIVASLQVNNLEVVTWRDMNKLIVEFETMANSYIAFFYLIILAITASVIINTLIMSVYERTREIGILGAIGMRGGRILWLFLSESALLAVGGVLLGIVLGWLAVYVINLSIMTFVVTLLAGLYPAVMASRMQPVEALRAEK